MKTQNFVFTQTFMVKNSQQKKKIGKKMPITLKASRDFQAFTVEMATIFRPVKVFIFFYEMQRQNISLLKPALNTRLVKNLCLPNACLKRHT